MSRSGYTDDWDNEGQLWLYRQAVARAIHGKRGQALLGELLAALDAMPIKRLIENDLEYGGEVCALGCLANRRGIDMGPLIDEDADTIAAAFGVARSLAAEIMYENDEGAFSNGETPEARWHRMRNWVASQVIL